VTSSKTGHPAAIAVDPSAYDERYFLTCCQGYDEFLASRGRRLGARFRKALDLARIEPGQRILDVGCGRGELVLHCALRGAEAVGIDYSEAAVRLAAASLHEAGSEVRGRASVLAMDATHLDFPSASFDLAFMTDVVEHLHPRELERALAEAFRVLKPRGRLIVHTCPNRLLVDRVYPAYVRRIHQTVVALCRLLRYQDDVFNTYLPTGPRYPRSPYERELHVNEQSPASLGDNLRRQGFRVRTMLFWEPPAGRPPARLQGLDFLRHLRPMSYFWPLNRLFCNHIWAVAERP
jgi:ubiquinone/menaquinone biosynthesis C-methylase UbiE